MFRHCTGAVGCASDLRLQRWRNLKGTRSRHRVGLVGRGVAARDRLGDASWRSVLSSLIVVGSASLGCDRRRQAVVDDKMAAPRVRMPKASRWLGRFVLVPRNRSRLADAKPGERERFFTERRVSHVSRYATPCWNHHGQHVGLDTMQHCAQTLPAWLATRNAAQARIPPTRDRVGRGAENAAEGIIAAAAGGHLRAWPGVTPLPVLACQWRGRRSGVIRCSRCGRCRAGSRCDVRSQARCDHAACSPRRSALSDGRRRRRSTIPPRRRKKSGRQAAVDAMRGSRVGGAADGRACLLIT